MGKLGKGSGLITPRIFISHAWEDKELVRRLEKALSAAGAEVWVDHAGVRGGDNLPKRINDALAWCNTLLLVWSKAAEESHWVELEWTNVISLKKRIIPCPHDGTPLPPILANRAYVNFANEAEGLRELFVALQLMSPSREARDAVVSPMSIPQPSRKRPALIQLRHTPVNMLSEDAVQMLHGKFFFVIDWNKSGKSIQNQYECVVRQSAKMVIDHATSLTWQQSGSVEYLSFAKAEAYVRQLKADKHGGHTDWRLPTVEEAMSLMEPEKNDGNLYLDPMFDKTQWRIWMADKDSAGRTWVVYFNYGNCTPNDIDSVSYVRAVRS